MHHQTINTNLHSTMIWRVIRKPGSWKNRTFKRKLLTNNFSLSRKCLDRGRKEISNVNTYFYFSLCLTWFSGDGHWSCWCHRRLRWVFITFCSLPCFIWWPFWSKFAFLIEVTQKEIEQSKFLGFAIWLLLTHMILSLTKRKSKIRRNSNHRIKKKINNSSTFKLWLCMRIWTHLLTTKKISIPQEWLIWE